MPKTFKILPKWRNFIKSGQTARRPQSFPGFEVVKREKSSALKEIRANYDRPNRR